MVLPKLETKQESVVVAQKMLHKGQLFSAIHNGNSVVALNECFGLRITKLNDNFVNLDLVRVGINAKMYSNIFFKPRQHKPPKTVTKKLEVTNKVKEEELL